MSKCVQLIIIYYIAKSLQLYATHPFLNAVNSLSIGLINSTRLILTRTKWSFNRADDWCVCNVHFFLRSVSTTEDLFEALNIKRSKGIPFNQSHSANSTTLRLFNFPLSHRIVVFRHLFGLDAHI